MKGILKLFSYTEKYKKQGEPLEAFAQAAANILLLNHFSSIPQASAPTKSFVLLCTITAPITYIGTDNTFVQQI